MTARSGLDFWRGSCMMRTMGRRLLLVATFAALALPVGVAHADEAPTTTTTQPPVIGGGPSEKMPNPHHHPAPTTSTTTAPSGCSVVVVLDGPVPSDGQQGPGSTVVAPCGQPIVIDGPAVVNVPAEAIVVAARYVPSWAALALGL